MVIASPSALGGALSKAEACTNDGPIEHLVDPEGIGSGSPSVVYAQSAKAQDGRDLVAAELPSVAVGAHGLPRELAPADAEAAYVAAHKDFLVRREAVAQPQPSTGSTHWITSERAVAEPNESLMCTPRIEE